jgi:hypothetical protein
MAEEEITAEQNNSSDDVQSSDCISVPSRNRSASILLFGHVNPITSRILFDHQLHLFSSYAYHPSLVT